MILGTEGDNETTFVKCFASRKTVKDEVEEEERNEREKEMSEDFEEEVITGDKHPEDKSSTSITPSLLRCVILFYDQLAH